MVNACYSPWGLLAEICCIFHFWARLGKRRYKQCKLSPGDSNAIVVPPHCTLRGSLSIVLTPLWYWHQGLSNFSFALMCSILPYAHTQTLSYFLNFICTHAFIFSFSLTHFSPSLFWHMLLLCITLDLRETPSKHRISFL